MQGYDAVQGFVLRYTQTALRGGNGERKEVVRVTDQHGIPSESEHGRGVGPRRDFFQLG